VIGITDSVIPAQAGIQCTLREQVVSIRHENWTPAFAGAMIYSYEFFLKFFREFTPKPPILRRRYFLQ
jgi:hypothetical protein